MFILHSLLVELCLAFQLSQWLLESQDSTCQSAKEKKIILDETTQSTKNCIEL